MLSEKKMDIVHDITSMLAQAGKDADRNHPYGHERMECVAAILLSVVLLITGLLIGRSGILKILHAGELAPVIPGLPALLTTLLLLLQKKPLPRMSLPKSPYS